MIAPRFEVGSMKTRSHFRSEVGFVLLAGLLIASCGGDAGEGDHKGPGGGAAGQRSAGGRPGSAELGGAGGGHGQPAASVPVEVSPVVRRSISSFIETNGTLEAENEVDIVARVTAPIVALKVEEGMEVLPGQVLARLDESELRSQADISRVNLHEAELAFERAKTLRDSQLVSPEEFEQSQSRVETARAQYESDRIQLSYAEIKAPFGGLIVSRYIGLAEQVSPGDPLFRISDFTPLLCPIQVPERDLPKLRLGQRAFLTFEAWPEKRFSAEVLRIRPIVDGTTGTVRVTLDVNAEGRLRPGMFARVFVETETRQNTLVIPKAALSLESIGDTVYVAADSSASRRNVELGFREGDHVEVLEGVAEGEQIIVVGQDGLSDGTPINVLGVQGVRVAQNPQTAAPPAPPPDDMPLGPDGRPDFSRMTPEQLERAKEFMRARGLSEKQIAERIGRAKPGQPGESQ
jgi:RND family efflux transporter MFP subunit